MIIKDVAELPDLEPGMLVQYKDDTWMQLLSEYSESIWLVNQLRVNDNGHPEVVWIMEGINFDRLKNIKSMHWANNGWTKALTHVQISFVLKDLNSADFTGCSWYNPEYLPVKKMTVSEIEKELGYRVEVVAETE